MPDHSRPSQEELNRGGKEHEQLSAFKRQQPIDEPQVATNKGVQIYSGCPNDLIRELAESAPSAPQPDQFLQTIRYLMLSWSVFYAKLPDGEYDGLGEMRTAVSNLKSIEAAVAAAPVSTGDDLIDRTGPEVAATAYQILGVLAYVHRCVPVRILDYFSAVAHGENPPNPLPFSAGEAAPVSQNEELEKLREDNDHLKQLLRCDPDDYIDDGFGSRWNRTCPTCGLGTMHINRPGEVQCDYCG